MLVDPEFAVAEDYTPAVNKLAFGGLGVAVYVDVEFRHALFVFEALDRSALVGDAFSDAGDDRDGGKG